MSTKIAGDINSLPSSPQGQGKHTEEKQYGLSKVLGQWLSIINRIKTKAENGEYSSSMCEIAQRDILYADINAGSGWNQEVNCIGSPLLYLEESKKYDFGQKIHFIEANADSLTKLGERVWEDYPEFVDLVELWNGNHSEILPGIIQKTGKRYGLIYHDPNGLPSFDLLRSISQYSDFRFVDILIRISGTNYKRIRNGLDAFGSKTGRPELVGKYPNLKIQLKSINKKQWIIRDIVDPDPSQWTFLLGINWTDYPSWESQGFYKIDSSKGAAILNRVSHTIKELGDFGNGKI